MNETKKAMFNLACLVMTKEPKELVYRPLIVFAENAPAALLLAREEMFREWPVAQGWSAHRAWVQPVSLNFFLALASMGADGMELSEEVGFLQIFDPPDDHKPFSAPKVVH